ncbi:MAG: hypothetical protein QE285_07365 [Aquabacterium sp.]|nr:hypothetical protein [Aquabacterium sp.]
MLKTLRRLITGPSRQADPAELRQWAADHGHGWRRVRDANGCVIDGRLGPQPWRIEWGAPQRDYISGMELRMMAELDLPKELSAMVLNRQLMETMENAVYERYVDDVKTRIDTNTPAEMRWLVMFSKTAPQNLGRLKERYGAVCSIDPWMQQWLHSPLNDALAATLDMAAPGEPVVLSIGRGRLTLRTALPAPDARRLAQWFSVFEHALREARRLGAEWRDVAGAGLTTQPSTWAKTEQPAGRSPDLGL